MKKYRLVYCFLLVFVIFLGILSRKTTLVPLCTGDFLYAIMIYIVIRILLTNENSSKILLVSLLVCYFIEFLQLYQAYWIIELRRTLFGRYVLGQGFLWSDIAAYTLGAGATFLIEKITFKIN